MRAGARRPALQAAQIQEGSALGAAGRAGAPGATRCRPVQDSSEPSSARTTVITTWSLLRRREPPRPRHPVRELIKHAAAFRPPPIRPHDMRHGAWSLMLSGGVSIEIVQMILGHSSLAVTRKVYTHLMRKAWPSADETAEKALTELRREQWLDSTGPIRRRKRVRLGRLVRREGIEPPTR